MTRRKQGEGTVFRRKDGRYVAQIRLENGKKKQRYCKTEKEANVALRNMLHEKEQGTLPIGPNQTLKVYLQEWVEQAYKLSAIRTGTYYMYSSIIRKHIVPMLGYIQLQKLTPQQIQTFYAKKLDEGLSAKTVSQFHTVLHNALSQAVKWNLVARNVCDFVTSPSLKRHEMKPLTPEQAQRLLEVARGHRLEALLTLAVTTGMRRGELLALHWDDIDLNEGSVYVRRTISRIGKFGLVESEPKTQRSKRKIALPSFVVAMLQQHRHHQLVMREKAGDAWQERDIVFCNRHGGYIEPANLFTDFKRLLEQASLPNIRFHDLRHSAASFLAKLNVHPKIVQEILGHSTISMTLDIYSHMFPSTHREAMGKLNDLFKREK
jgi:integrase